MLEHIVNTRRIFADSRIGKTELRDAVFRGRNEVIVVLRLRLMPLIGFRCRFKRGFFAELRYRRVDVKRQLVLAVQMDIEFLDFPWLQFFIPFGLIVRIGSRFDALLNALRKHLVLPVSVLSVDVLRHNYFRAVFADLRRDIALDVVDCKGVFELVVIILRDIRKTAEYRLRLHAERPCAVHILLPA